MALFTDLYTGEDVPRPHYWGGYCLTPTQYEFWQSQAFRLHDRRKYTWDEAHAVWTQSRLNP